MLAFTGLRELLFHQGIIGVAMPQFGIVNFMGNR